MDPDGRNLFDGPFGRAYAFYMGRERLARAIGLLLWGGDTRPTYSRLQALRSVPPGGLVVDAPCGAGLAFRALDPAANVRYLALDLSAVMLRRAREEARRRGLGQIEFVEGDALHIPVPADSADLFLSLWGLHCFDDPEAALDEVDRCLAPGGSLVGSSFISDSGVRGRLMVRPHRGAFGLVVPPSRLRGWLVDRFELVDFDVSGPFAYFTARSRRG